MVLDFSLDFFDHLLSFGKKDENDKVIPTKFETTTYSKDQMFIVGFILFLIISFSIYKIQSCLRKHYKKKYAKSKQNEIELQPFRTNRHPGTVYLA